MQTRSVINVGQIAALALICLSGTASADDKSGDRITKKIPSGQNAAAESKSAQPKKTAGKTVSARDIKQGMSLYKSYDCAACHRIGNKGCSDGVPLDGVGKKRSEQFLQAHLKDPEEHVNKNRKAFPGTSTNMMPKPDLEPEQLKLIVKYLLSLH